MGAELQVVNNNPDEVKDIPGGYVQTNGLQFEEDGNTFILEEGNE